MTMLERFWAKVEKTNSCWLWTGTIGSGGYGYIARPGGFGSMPAHRYSYFVHFGDMPAGAYVCHHCDVRNCVNPDHLYAGDAQSNIEDRDLRRRTAAGNRHGRARLTEEQALEIYRRAWSGENQFRLAEEFGMSQVNVSAIKHGRNWASVTGHNFTGKK